MEENKKELLSQLLTIKAGMAVIATEADKIRPLEEEYKKAEEEYRGYQRIMRDWENAQNADPVLTADDIKAQEGAKTAQENKKKRKIALAIGAAIALLGLVMMGSGGVFSTAVIFAGIGVMLLGLVVFGKKPVDDIYISRVQALEERQKSSREWKNTRREQDERAAKVAEINYRKAKLAYDEACDVSLPLAKLVYDTLYENYNDVLRERDWKHVDLLFHYLDSGYADTKKEALLLVEKKIQNDEIVNAIRHAAEEIRDSIRTATDLMRYDMERHFSALSTQLAAQHAELCTHVGYLGGQVAARLDAIKENSAMQNALLSNLKNDSAHIARDVRYMAEHERLSEYR